MANQTIEEIDNTYPDILFRAIAIQRGHETIIPNAQTIIRRSDHIYLVTNNDQIDSLVKIVGKESKQVKKIMIIGGSEIGLKAAQILENQYSITIIEQDKTLCKRLINQLHNTLVVKGNPGNIELLKEEGLARMDVFVAVTPNSETNIVTSLMAEEYGVYKTIAMVDNMDYVPYFLRILVSTPSSIKN